MLSHDAEHAIDDALVHGQALLKFISANDAGVTGSHQAGFYLPKSAWHLYTPQAPVRGVTHKHDITVTWQDGTKTDSVVTWYGQETRSEYRLTKFGRGFDLLNKDSVGNLLVLVRVAHNEFLGYVLDNEEDIETLQTTLGVYVRDRWAVYDDTQPLTTTPDSCLEKDLNLFVSSVTSFPTGKVFSQTAIQALEKCVTRFKSKSIDARLVQAVETEYRLFTLVERHICGSQVQQPFKDIDEFLDVAQSIVNRRRTRAGRSWENHFGQILDQAGIPYESQPKIDGKPDIVIPGSEEYKDKNYPIDRLFVVGLKTTCKDRWRQVLKEGKRVNTKHLATLQAGISVSQLDEMANSDVALIVPKSIQPKYPKGSSMNLLSVEEFIDQVRSALANA